MGKAKQLSMMTRESIARKLFEVRDHSERSSELTGLCPFHEDTNPSFSYNYEKDVFNCFSCGVTGDLIKLWSKVRGSGNMTDDFKAFCREHGIELKSDGNPPVEKKSSPKKSSKEKAKKIPQATMARAFSDMPDLSHEWREKLKKDRGWSSDAIDRLNLRLQTWRWDKKAGALREVQKPDRVAIPVFDTFGALRNIRCYAPGAASMKIFSYAPGTGAARLFPAKPDDEGIVLIVEGEADCICAISNGFNAITQTSKTKYWPTDQSSLLAGRDVVIAYDADQPGQKYAKHAAQSLVSTAKRIRMLEWPDWMGKLPNGEWPDDHGQDLTDFFVKHGKSADDLKEIINQAKNFEFNEETAPDVMAFFEHGPNGRLSFKPRLLADRICRDMDIITDSESSLIYRWNGRYFEQFPEEHIEKRCLDLLGDESQQSRAKDATYQVKRLTVIPYGRRLNDRDDWICLINGMFNLRTLELNPHDKSYYQSYGLPVVFDPDRATRCERFLQFLDETIQTPGPIAQVQEYIGYCLTRDVRYEKALLLLGPGADGKSKLINVIESLVGHENCCAVSFQDLENEFHRSSLYGKLLNISTEVGSRAMESAYFKAIVSGDPISAAFKHQNAFHFRPHCKLVFAGNRLPRILDNSDGPFRRLLPISFKRQFINDGDPDLKEKLINELSDIFQWALVGLHRLWSQKRFTDCEETQNLLMEHRRANNPVLCFVEDCCVIGEHEDTSKVEIYKKYKTYAGTNGYSIMGKENFFRELYAAVANIKQHRPTTSQGRTYYLKGIGLTGDEE